MIAPEAAPTRTPTPTPQPAAIEPVEAAPSEILADPAGEAVASEAAEATEAPAINELLPLEETLADIYRDVNPSVVNIRVIVGQEGSEGLIPQGGGAGSGFVWDKDGHIVTNNHVVEEASRITVVFSDGSSYRAEVVGTDPYSDLAVVKIDRPAAELSPIEVADSREVSVGQLAVAIGNPFGLDGTMTVGFISALGRSLPVGSAGVMAPSYNIPDIIQTDAPINPGNSGGVLVDSSGRLIGVPSAIESPVRANAGIGFAVPSAIVLNVVPDLIATGVHEHPWVGFSGGSLLPEVAEAMGLEEGQRGVIVSSVVEGGPAEAAGLRGSSEEVEIEGLSVPVGGDVIVAIDGEAVREFDDLIIYLSRSTRVGQSVTLTVLRDGEVKTLEVVLAARPTE
jgi:2-alkenal reductase